jgi:hypothetical protein
VPGEVEGTYEVAINLPDKRRVFEGSLSISKLGAAFTLMWSGKQLLLHPRDARYIGIGIIGHNDTLIATFQEEIASV